ncbi:MAG: caspase domain-containing protein [Terracidiphilus sp.]
MRGAWFAKWAIFGAVLFQGFLAAGQDSRCGAGRDLVVQALERISPQSNQNAFEDALQLLKHAVSECGELGDAWYYRSLVEQRLGHDSLAHYAMDKARFVGSEALEQQLNPLILSTPATRGFVVEASTTHSSQPAPVKPGPVQQKWALVIGISRFVDDAIPRLKYTTADANAFAAELKDPTIGRFPATNVHVLTDEQATTRNIKEQLNWIARHASPNDLVVIYLATHGTPRTLDSAGGANYLVTYDTEIYHSGSFDEDTMYATAYPMVELADSVATRMKALRTAVILDTCYSGGSVKNQAGSANPVPPDKPPSREMLERMSQGTGRIVMTASQADEESLESGEFQHGYFTYYLLEALKSGRGNTPLSQIYAAVAQKVAQRVSAGGMHQHPVMSRSSEDADFALGVAGTEPAGAQP